jgi:hypothetical protein
MNILQENLHAVHDLLKESLAVMQSFPQGYTPQPLKKSGLRSDASFVSRGARFTDPKIGEEIQRIINRWPKPMTNAFLRSSAYLGSILHTFGKHMLSGITDGEVIQAGVSDPEIMNLMMNFAQLKKESDKAASSAENPEADSDLNFDAMPDTLWHEIERRILGLRIPYSKTITTLLGPNALVWLSAESSAGVNRIQPQEFSRFNLYRLQNIGDQIQIETELLQRPEGDYELSKIVVALCWNMVALSAFMEPEIFLGEQEMYISSIRETNRETNLAFSQGEKTMNLHSFSTPSVTNVISVLSEALLEPQIDCCDMMWMATGLARQTIKNENELRVTSTDFNYFLSHRGKDSKKVLADKMLEKTELHDVFLDCLSLPKGVINRKFVFDSLGHSRTILIIDSPAFNDSVWCRKELWFTKQMSRIGEAKFEMTTLPGAMHVIENIRESAPPKIRKKGYPITPRILRDIDNFGRQPNKYSLEELKYSTDYLRDIEDLMTSNQQHRIGKTNQVISNLFNGLTKDGWKFEPIAKWSTAMQYAIAAMATMEITESKMEVRRGIDKMNVILTSMSSVNDSYLQKHGARHLFMLGIAITLDLTKYEMNPLMTKELTPALEGAAVIRNGILLLNVMNEGEQRDMHIRLLKHFTKAGVGSVGIVQSATDLVHQMIIDGEPLEILPCVTLYPGMEKLYPEFFAA